jgi:hypothetical protein
MSGPCSASGSGVVMGGEPLSGGGREPVRKFVWRVKTEDRKT